MAAGGDAGKPRRVTAGELGAKADLAAAGHDGPLELDVGNLMAYSPAAVDPAAFGTGDDAETEAAALELARGITQALVGAVFQLPTAPAPIGRLAELPAPATAVPRYQAVPRTDKPKTKWQQFAEEKGITKRKRSKLVFDELTQDWKRRHGYGKANDVNDLAIVEAKLSDAPGADPFAVAKKAKKKRVEANRTQQVENLLRRTKEGGRLPATISLTASHLNAGVDKSYLGEAPPAAPAQRRSRRGDLEAATTAAAAATASMGKFDRRGRGEKDVSKAGRKQQHTAVVGAGGGVSAAEKASEKDAISRVLKRNAGGLVNSTRMANKRQVEVEGERRAKKGKAGRKKK